MKEKNNNFVNTEKIFLHQAPLQPNKIISANNISSDEGWGVGHGHRSSKLISFWFSKITLYLCDLLEDIAILMALHIVFQASIIINDDEFCLCCIIWWSGMLSDLLKLLEDRDFVPVCLSQHVRVSLSLHLGPCTSAAGSSHHLLHRE